MNGSTTELADQQNVDVLILGAGMAGLTLARQLQLDEKCAARGLSIQIVEHRRFPVAEATHKVGESTVEIASHYLAEQLGLRAHLEQHQLPKFGLRLFLRGEQAIEDDLARYDEIGASQVLPVPTYQIDRGRFENALAEEVLAAGASVADQTTVREIELARGKHRVRLRDADGREVVVTARYLVDASGRRAWLRGQQDLARSARHDNHAFWCRVEGDLDLDTWSDDSSWQQRCPNNERRLSTNHFTGPGYWLWLIPLASGSTSVGLVFDPKIVDPKPLRSFDGLLSFLADEHPLVAKRLRACRSLDSHVLQNYAVASRQVFSEDGWMASGDAGVFTDPFYSPGGDFIALANGYITRLIADDVPADAARDFQGYFLSFFTSTLSLYRGQYGGFGDRDFMVGKTLWDYSYYWSVLSKLYFTGAYLDRDFMKQEQPTLLKAAGLNSGMQKALRNAARAQRRVGGEGRFFDHHSVDVFHQLKSTLLTGDADIGASLATNVAMLERLRQRLQPLLAGAPPSEAFNALFEAA